MLISYEWLKKYFDALPPPAEISDAFSKHLTEVEKIEKKGSDSVFDIKVLPDRNCYAQSHRGIAYELSAIKDIPIKKIKATSFDVQEIKDLKIDVQEKEMCSRYIGRRMENIKVTESPSWLKDLLEAIGQRSINNVVDSLNYVMFDMGQPLHAFDADKVKGDIMVRFAKSGETLTTLDGKEVKLNEHILVIADEEGPLALAGIKGGKRAEVDNKTANIIIESANFNKSLIRVTSAKLGIKSDASKRYENGLATSFAETGMSEATVLISSMNPEAKIGATIDVHSHPEKPAEIRTSIVFLSNRIGLDIEQKEILDISRRLNIKATEINGELLLLPPPERLDLTIPEDIVEEVARLYGYEKIPSADLKKLDVDQEENPSFIWRENIKDALKEMGFGEIMTHTLASSGDLEIEKSIAEDKNFARTNLSDNMAKALSLNLYNAPLLGLNQIKIFEIGKVFPKSGEYTSLCMGIANTKNHKGESINEEIRRARETLIEKINAKVTTLCTIDDNGGILVMNGKQMGKINEIDGIMELNLDVLISTLHIEVELLNPAPSDDLRSRTPKYRPISPYPFVLRDIAVFVPGEKGNEDKVWDIIKVNGTEFLIRADLFDTFTKTFKDTGEVKTSYAYRLVFQSTEKTLNDEEINKIMEQISSKMAQQGWEVR